MSDAAFDNELLDEEQESFDGAKYLLCKLGDEVYGVDISVVTDIIELQKIIAIPEMPEYVRGVINLRGRVIPVVDLRLRFGMEERSYDDRTVITVVKLGERSIGLIVDTATEVQDILNENIAPPPDFHRSQGHAQQYIAGLGKLEEQVIIILDMDRLISAEEMERLQSEAET